MSDFIEDRYTLSIRLIEAHGFEPKYIYNVAPYVILKIGEQTHHIQEQYHSKMSGKTNASFEGNKPVLFEDLTFTGLTKKLDGKQFIKYKGKNIKLSLKSINTLMFVDQFKNDEHYGDAIFENFPKLVSFKSMTETKTLGIKSKGKITGQIKIEVSLQLKPAFHQQNSSQEEVKDETTIEVEDNQKYTCIDIVQKKLTQATHITGSTQNSSEEEKFQSQIHDMDTSLVTETEYSEDDQSQIDMEEAIEVAEHKDKILALLGQGTKKLYDDKLKEFYEKNKSKYESEIVQATQPEPNTSVESIRQKLKEQRKKFKDDFDTS